MKEIKDLKLQEIVKLNELNEKDLKLELVKSAKDLFVLRMKKEQGELKQTHLITALRKYIAQLNTVASSK
ncbi:50S ribosomal protein L29 [bacterium]|jgi:ribosomal protein L29|nr:50S ribosomal protein L29 [bacterium]MBT5491079.1 50S ribosomal protein L29 [bacterium]MBT6779150.1 50S ribosomal protein L29 [bacterium]